MSSALNNEQEIKQIKRMLRIHLATITIPMRQWLYYIVNELEIIDKDKGIKSSGCYLRSKAFPIEKPNSAIPFFDKTTK